MILTGTEIAEARRRGDLVIEPFKIEQLNPNSYNLRLDSLLKVYTPDHTPDVSEYIKTQTPLPAAELDCKKEALTFCFEIPPEGYVLHPGKLYLGSTIEWTESSVYVPFIDGRSSFARLGLSMHQTGGFGDLGFKGQWTIEMSCVEPVRIYAHIAICQIQFQVPHGQTTLQYDTQKSSKYTAQRGPTPSRLFKET